ncbi:hypothetical protein HPB52_022807 [Rhipicephalus sanguineus]|uniref:Cytochrome P450 n=1 Tax=Rhipicephalus sanguineus TaxID=34632 RepID=A0A9D4QEN0_RHISA|nr:hypothetical protein HPB52_022807 [Rhipicephalus sanguineus]
MWRCTLESLFVGTIAGIVAALVGSLWRQLQSSWRPGRAGLPPGPRGLPFLGYLPFMLRDGHHEVVELRKKYGNVFGCPTDSQHHHVMAAIMFGKRFEQQNVSGHVTLNDVIEIVDLVPALSAKPRAANLFPWLRKLMCFLGLGISAKPKEVLARRDRFTESAVAAHEETLLHTVTSMSSRSVQKRMCSHGGISSVTWRDYSSVEWNDAHSPRVAVADVRR